MADIKIFNTLSKKKETFKPLKQGEVLIYHCGPTVYWTQHIGNMRGMAMADLIVRTFQYNKYKLTLVRNYTDVGHMTSDQDEGEDKMEKAAKRDDMQPEQIAQKYIKIFEDDLKELNMRPADYKPKATETIPEIITMVQTLLSTGYAYNTPLAIYFDVSKAKNYSRLSRQKIEKNIKEAGKGEVSDPQKKHPADFALWFFKAGQHKNALQFWASPFKSPLTEDGNGFPGWAIECSAMAKKFLGLTIDIHMGGIEHIPVHHTNEIAQSEAANGVEFVHYWLHNEHLMVNGQKMSKSQGTGYALSEIKEKGFEPLTLRYFFLQSHYRSKQNFTWEALTAAQSGYQSLKEQVSELGSKKGKVNLDFKNKFLDKINDDFNVPSGVAVVYEVLKSKLSSNDKLATIIDFDQVLGLQLNKIKKEKIDLPATIKKLISERKQARQEKNWQLSDELRDKISVLGFKVEDTQDGQKISKN